MSNSTESLLARLLIGTGELEKQVEVVRQVLAEQPLFEPYAVFQRLDRSSKGYITPTDIANFVRSNGRQMPYKKAGTYLVKYYALELNNKLTYQTFLPIVLPTCSPILRKLACQRPNYQVAPDQFLDYDVEYSLLRVFEREFAMFNMLEKMREQLCTRFDFSMQKCFRSIDKKHEGQIGLDNIRAFLRKKGYVTEITDILAIVRRMDKAGTAQIGYQEFFDYVLPVRPIDNKRRLPSYATPTKNFIQKVTQTMKGKQPRINMSGIPNKSMSNPQRQGLSMTWRSPIKDMKTDKGRKGKRSKSQMRSRSRGDGLSLSQTFSRSKLQPKNVAFDDTLLKSPGDTEREFVTPSKYHARHLNQAEKVESAEKMRTASEKTLKSILKNSGDSTQGSPQKYPEPFTNENKEGENVQNINIIPESYSHGIGRNLSPPRLISISEEECKAELLRGVREQIRLEIELEKAKEELALLGDFDLKRTFTYFDIDNKGFISSNDILKVLDDLSIIPQQDDVYLFVHRYDDNLDAILSYQNFCEAFLPKDSTYARLLLEKENRPGMDPLLETSTLAKLRKLIQCHLAVERDAEIIRHLAHRNPDFNIQVAFKLNDKEAKGYLNLTDLKSLFESCHQKFSPKQLGLLFSRYDKDKDNRISYQEFYSEWIPKSAISYTKQSDNILLKLYWKYIWSMLSYIILNNYWKKIFQNMLYIYIYIR